MTAKDTRTPVITSVNPTVVDVGAAGVDLIVQGTNFKAGDVITWNGIVHSTTVLNSTHLKTSIAASMLASPGTALVEVVSPKSRWTRSNVVKFTITSRHKQRPTIALSVTPTSGTAPLAVTASTARAMASTGATITSTSIDFGDGTIVSAAAATHSYSRAGNYTVKATVIDSKGSSSTATQTVAVAAPPSAPTAPPVAHLSVTPTNGTAPLAITASTAGSSASPGETIASTSIDFGDGTIVKAAAATHAYSMPGNYTAKATVTDSKGSSSAATQTVTVAAPTATPTAAPVAHLSVTPTSGTAPLAVTASTAGSSASAGATIASTSINFGDGTVANTASASHTYSATGNYTVTATVTDNLGSSSTATAQVSAAANSASACGAMSLGLNGALNGFNPLAPNDPLRANISSWPVASDSATQICTMDAASNTPQNICGKSLYWHFDEIGSSGMPYQIVDNTQPMQAVTVTNYARASDPSGPSGETVFAPFVVGQPVEGGPNGTQDTHAFVINRDSCWDFETYAWGAILGPNHTWNPTFFIANWDLLNLQERPLGWTSADASGMPIWPLLLKYDEAVNNNIKHALRLTPAVTRAAYIRPARFNTTSQVCGGTKCYPAMGARFRLHASFDCTFGGGAPSIVQNICGALKTYGLIVDDNSGYGSFTSQADANPNWPSSVKGVNYWAQMHVSDFDEVVDPTAMTSSGTAISYGPDGNTPVPTGPAPTISAFTASPTTITLSTCGSNCSTTLSWAVNEASYLIVEPNGTTSPTNLGPVRGNSVDVTPTQTTTYTLHATNEFGVATATVTVFVH